MPTIKGKNSLGCAEKAGRIFGIIESLAFLTLCIVDWLPSKLLHIHTSVKIQRNETSQARLKSIQECVFTDWLGVELCVQNLQRLQVPLGVGPGLCGINRTRHFLFFFVLHLCVDVEAWDLP